MNAIETRAELGTMLFSLASVAPENGCTFTVRGWPMAILRNGGLWDLLSPSGLSEALNLQQLHDEVQQAVIDAEADNAGWDFDPTELRI